MTATALAYASLASTAVSAGVAVYQSNQQAKDAESAAEFNAKQTRKAAEVATDDSRNNALRKQESYRKQLASLRTRMFEKSGTIEGGDQDFLDESVGDLQLRILDDSVAGNRQQAAYANQAFSYEYQGAQAAKAGMINTGASVLNGFASTYQAGAQQGFWGPNSEASKKKAAEAAEAAANSQ